jgi:hypothetical protein
MCEAVSKLKDTAVPPIGFRHEVDDGDGSPSTVGFKYKWPKPPTGSKNTAAPLVGFVREDDDDGPPPTVGFKDT